MTVTTPVIAPESEDTFSMQPSHTLDAIEVTFDDGRLVADAGLIQPATLAQHLGSRGLFDTHVDLGRGGWTRQRGAIPASRTGSRVICSPARGQPAVGRATPR